MLPKAASATAPAVVFDDSPPAKLESVAAPDAALPF
jgi:hypothetical protein